MKGKETLEQNIKVDNNKEKYSENKIIFSFIISLFLGTFTTVLLLPFVTWGNQTYTDIIYGISNYDVNKSGEMSLFKTILILSCILGIYICNKWNKREIEYYKFNNISLPVTFIVVANILIYFIAGTLNEKLLLASIFYLCTRYYFGEKANKLTLMAISSYYFILGMISFSTVFTQHTLGKSLSIWKKINQSEIFIITAIIIFIIIYLWLKKGEHFLTKAILLLQIFVPLNFSMYLKDMYIYGGKTINILYPTTYYLIIFSIIIVLMVLAIRKFDKYRKDKLDISLENLISLSLVITIFAINSYIVSAKIAPSDLWHHGEQITSWQQIITQGLGAYTSFCPSSGFYSLVLGFVLNVFMDGSATSYAAAYSMVSMIFAIISILLIYYLADSKISLFVALSSGMVIYNRGYMILPYLLILSFPKLINNRSNWLKTWMLLSLFVVLYYPSNGMAVIAATAPFGIIQIIQFFKTKEFAGKIKKAGFWMGWVAAFTVVFANLRILINMAKYILNLANQSVAADGLPLLDYTSAPDYFMNWISVDVYRQIAYLVVRIAIPSSIIILSSIILFQYLKSGNKEEKFISPLFLGLSSSILFVFVNFSYTLVRADNGCLLARTSMSIIIVGIYLSVILYKFGHGFITKSFGALLSGSIMALVMLLFIVSNISNFPQVDIGTQIGGIANDANRLVPYYELSTDTYTYINEEMNTAYPKLGTGFMATSNYQVLNGISTFIKENKMQDEYFTNLPRFFYYILNLKAPYVDSTKILQSIKAQNAVIEDYAKTNPVITDISPMENYEICKWLADNNYKQLNNGWCVNDKIIEKCGLKNSVVATKLNFRVPDFQRNASAFGKSFDSLEKLFKDEKECSQSSMCLKGLTRQGKSIIVNDSKNACITISFKKPISGKKYDYIYINFDTNLDFRKDYQGGFTDRLRTYFNRNTKNDLYDIAIKWSDAKNAYATDNFVSMRFGNGKLLIPVGYNTSWRSNEINEFQIVLSQAIPNGTKIKVNSIKLLKTAVLHK